MVLFCIQRFILLSPLAFVLILSGCTVFEPTDKRINIIVPDSSARSLAARDRQLPLLRPALEAANLVAGDDVFLRIFKQESQLELWMKPRNSKKYKLFKTYPICNFSGTLGPKQQEGDHQSPEGFYAVTPQAMNPNSSYHLSFNLGYPNKLERDLGRTGSLLMVHGGCDSVGCYALTDPLIEEVYTLVNEAMLRGQNQVHVHAFPFRLTAQNLGRASASPWIDFWVNLKEGYDAFEATHVPPQISATKQTYIVKRQRRSLGYF